MWVYFSSWKCCTLRYQYIHNKSSVVIFTDRDLYIEWWRSLRVSMCVCVVVVVGGGLNIYADFLWSSKFRIVSLIWATERADLKWFPASLLQTLTRWGLQTTEEMWRRALDMHNHMWFSWWGKETACVCPPVCITLRGELKTIAHHSA